MTVRMVDVVGGRVVPDVSELDAAGALARKREVEAALGALKGDPKRSAAREALKLENECLSRRLTELREQAKAENMRRNFAGLASPLFEALVERFDAAVVAELERDALRRLAEREQRNADRKAKKKVGGVSVNVVTDRPAPLALRRLS